MKENPYINKESFLVVISLTGTTLEGIFIKHFIKHDSVSKAHSSLFTLTRTAVTNPNQMFMDELRKGR